MTYLSLPLSPSCLSGLSGLSGLSALSLSVSVSVSVYLFAFVSVSGCSYICPSVLVFFRFILRTKTNKQTNKIVLDVPSREAVRADGSGGHDGLGYVGLLNLSLPAGVQRHDHQRERQVERGEDYQLHVTYICVAHARIRRLLTLGRGKQSEPRNGNGIQYTRDLTPVTG